MDFGDILRRVDSIYEAAVDPSALANIGSQVAHSIGAESALVFVARKHDARLVRMVSATGNFDAGARSAYDQHFHSRNEWFLRGARLPSPMAVLGGELISYDDFERTEFWNDWCKTVGIYHTLGSTAPIGNGRIAAMGIHRPRGREAFGEAERAVVRLVVPHLARSLLLAERLETATWQKRAADQVLFGLGIGLILLGGGGEVVFVNATAERLVSRSRWMTVSQGRVRATHPASAAALSVAIGRAIDRSNAPVYSGDVLRLRDPLASDLAILVTPFRAADALTVAGQPVAAIVFANPDRTTALSGRVVARMLGLTPAEGALAAVLASGKTLGEHALSTRISINTARAHLRSILAKTQLSRQSELVGAVLRSPLGLLASDPDI